MSDTKKKIVVGDQPIYDASSLGAPKIAILGFQHVFAMFGATVLVPLLTGLDLSSTLLFAGLGTQARSCRMHASALPAQVWSIWFWQVCSVYSGRTRL